jgi:Leucine-rich repeat (LRR) protein
MYCLIVGVFCLQNMRSLVSIDFTDCMFLREVPDMSAAPNLMSLNLDNCINVTEIHDSVGFLDNLEELTATGCTSLETIPVAFELSSLRVLSFSECSKLTRFPEILCKIKNLQHINLCQTAIEELPFSIGNVTGLVVLTLMDCPRLDKLPSSIFTLPRLQEIQADSCKGFGIEEDNGPLNFTVSPNKIHLYLSSCNLTDEHLFICLNGFANVVHLDISYSNFTVLPPCIKECIHLNTLLLTNCMQLQEISAIPQKLREIDASNCISLTSQSQSVLSSQVFLLDLSCLIFCTNY